MRASVKQEETANPLKVSVLGSAAVMSGAQDFYHAVIEPQRPLSPPADQEIDPGGATIRGGVIMNVHDALPE